MPYDTNGPSRLSDGLISYRGGYITVEQFRDIISSRKTFTLENEYVDSSKLSLKNKGKVASGISSILGAIPQFNSLGLKNSLASRLLGENTPLTEIGTVMLGKQMFYNSISHLSQQYLPSIDLSKILKGKNPFSLPIDYSITKNASAGLLDKITSAAFFKTNSFANSYPFNKNTTNVEYIENTGNAQLSKLFKSINLNKYKQISEGYGDTTTQTLLKYSDEDHANVPILSQSTVIQSNNIKYFNFNNSQYHPYLINASLYSTEEAIVIANNNMLLSVADTENITQEYAPNAEYVRNNFGVTNKTSPITRIDDFVNNDDADNINDRIVWGRDGVSTGAKSVISQLHGNTGNEDANYQTTTSLNNDYRVNGGLLEYTRNLLNATSGRFVDITRKAFKEGEKIVGFNGSPLWKANDSTYANSNGIAGGTGVRQHTVLDQYDRFAKAIRFKGNVIYNGNPNSVAHQSVLPRIHPTRDENGGVNNKNMMFSIENLAVRTFKNGGYGIVEDEYGTGIPLSEVGNYGGRVLWFPPYDLQVNETANAKYESTVMVGRSEPMYNYMNSERSATISFTLLVDYPPHLKQYFNDSNYKRKSADFFAFGGDPIPAEQSIDDMDKQIKLLENQINKITGPISTVIPELSSETITVYFQNDLPLVGQEGSVFDVMYRNPNHYEITKSCDSGSEGKGDGLNEEIYYISGLTNVNGNKWILDSNISSSFSQYTVGVMTQQEPFGVNKLNETLFRLFNNVEYRKYYEIEIIGSATKLYENKVNEPKYNKELGQRRADATKKLIEDRLKIIFSLSDLNEFTFTSTSSEGSTNSSIEGADAKNMNLTSVKQERKAVITFKVKSDVTPDKVGATGNGDEINLLQTEISKLETKRNALKNINETTIFNVKKYEDSAILKTYEATYKNNFHPIYHTQTPEDFHRRLTFLHQCTRQGTARRIGIKENNEHIRNSVFGRQPICVLRVGDFFHTKVIIESVNIDYNDTTWDTNPEGFGVQPMLARVTLSLKLIGGQSLKGPIDALQNASTFNYYANSTFQNTGMYARPSKVESDQFTYQETLNKKNAESNAAIIEILQKSQNKDKI